MKARRTQPRRRKCLQTTWSPPITPGQAASMCSSTSSASCSNRGIGTARERGTHCVQVRPWSCVTALMPWLVGEGETATQRAANGGARETPVSTWRRADQGHAGGVRAGREDGQARRSAHRRRRRSSGRRWRSGRCARRPQSRLGAHGRAGAGPGAGPHAWPSGNSFWTPVAG